MFSKPKTYRTCYNYFTKANFSKMREISLDKDFGSISKMLNSRWRLMTEQDKDPYRVLGQTDMARYKREILEFYQNGFYHEEPREEIFPE